MERAIIFGACLAFGGLFLLTGAHAQEVKGVYCKVDLKEITKGNGLIGFLKRATDCEVEVETKWGDVEFDSPILPSVSRHWRDWIKDE